VAVVKDKIKKIYYLFHLIKFTADRNRIFYVSIITSIVSAGIEILAMSSILPLVAFVTGSKLVDGGLTSWLIRNFQYDVDAKIILWVFFLLLFLRVATQMFGQTLIILLGKRVMAQLCTEAFSSIVISSTIKEINKNSIGYYTNLAGDESSRGSALVISVMQFIPTAILSILYFIAIIKYSINVAVGLTFFIIICSFFLYFVGKLSHRLGVRQLNQSRLTGSLFLDALNNLKTIRFCNAQSYIIKRQHSEMFRYTKILFWVDEVGVLTRYVPILLVLTLFGLAFYFNAGGIESVGLEVVIALIAYLTRFLPTLGQGVSLLLRIASDAASGRDVTGLIRANKGYEKCTVKSIGKIYSISIKNLYFSYDGLSSKQIIKDFSFTFNSGVRYALVGGSGVGKSTLAEVLLKCYLPDSGSITINETPYVEIDEVALRDKVVLVGQEDAIFDDTIWNNICLGRPATLEEVRHACEISCVLDVIDAMPQGFNTRLNYQGTNLSGGQRQRIAIARAVLKKPAVLILDETTNALDDVTKAAILERIKIEYQSKIVIFITHDPAVIEAVDCCVDIARESGGNSY
jgi:ABC-type multidrug transport system fused ATPase/permease subunit